MPVSKSGQTYFTQEQYQTARRITALEYAQRRGYDLVPCGHRYLLREHDSMVFLPDGRWFWNSRNLKGGAIEFIQAYEGRSLPEAVMLLCDLDGIGTTATQPAPQQKKSSAFILPPADNDDRRLCEYLIQKRCLDAEIVSELIKQGRIYLARHRNGRMMFCNAVFVGFDKQHIPRSASVRGITYGNSYKGEAVGSNKMIPFEVPGASEAQRLAVFEGAIDAISHASIEKQDSEDWRQTVRISQSGAAAPGMVLNYLREHPRLTTVLACYDNDTAGQEMEKTLRRELEGMEVEIISAPPPRGKDWNDYLVLRRYNE